MARTRLFGRSGWRVAEVGLGCWQFGGAVTLDGQPDGWTGVTDEESLATLQRAVELGINFFDTSDQYGWGHSEELIGRALKPFRDQVYIATKVGFGHDDQDRRTCLESKEEIFAACERSLQRLRTDRIDLYQCHLWRTERWTEFLEAFDALQRQGKIRLFGVSTNDFDMVQRFDETRKLGSVQSNFNLLDRRAESDIIPYCRARGIAFVARGPIARGRLSGRYTPTTRFAENDNRQRWLATEENRAAYVRDLEFVERLRPISQKSGFTLAQLAIKVLLAHVGVSVVIPGAKNRVQLEENLTASVLPPLTPEELGTVRHALTAE